MSRWSGKQQRGCHSQRQARQGALPLAHRHLALPPGGLDAQYFHGRLIQPHRPQPLPVGAQAFEGVYPQKPQHLFYLPAPGGEEVLQELRSLLRIHPAASRVALLARETPASYVAFDLLALDEMDLRDRPGAERRAQLEGALAAARPPLHLTPATTDRATAADWFARFEGAGLDGVVAKRLDAPYQPGKRVMLKIKHERTADCVVAGFRWHKNGPGTHVGSLLLGLYDAEGCLHHVGVTSTFSWDRRAALARELEPLRQGALEGHPWREWAEWAGFGDAEASGQRLPGAVSRWSRGKDLSWEAVRPERVCEVAYDHLQGNRFRHGTTFLRWRPDKRPEDCRYDQLEVTPPFEIGRIFGR